MGENSCIDRCVSKYWQVNCLNFTDVFPNSHSSVIYWIRQEKESWYLSRYCAYRYNIFCMFFWISLCKCFLSFSFSCPCVCLSVHFYFVISGELCYL